MTKMKKLKASALRWIGVYLFITLLVLRTFRCDGAGQAF